MENNQTMKANELRIGNYYNQFGNTEKVCHVVIKNLTEAPDGQLWCKPIPLTEEWLLRMGFDRGINNWFGIKYFTDMKDCVEEMKIDYNTKSNRLAIYDAIEETDMVKILSYPIYSAFKVKYVHQLQNLYYALTNQELEIKES